MTYNLKYAILKKEWYAFEEVLKRVGVKYSTTTEKIYVTTTFNIYPETHEERILIKLLIKDFTKFPLVEHHDI